MFLSFLISFYLSLSFLKSPFIYVVFCFFILRIAFSPWGVPSHSIFTLRSNRTETYWPQFCFISDGVGIWRTPKGNPVVCLTPEVQIFSWKFNIKGNQSSSTLYSQMQWNIPALRNPGAVPLMTPTDLNIAFHYPITIFESSLWQPRNTTFSSWNTTYL